MNKQLSPLVLVAFTLAGMAACDRKDPSTTDTTDTNSDSDTGAYSAAQEPPRPEAFAALTQAVRASLVQTYGMDAGADATVTGAQGTVLTFSADSLVDEHGGLAAGDVDIRLVEVYNKGTMLVAGLPSTGRNGDGAIAQLVSGGMHFVDATQGGRPLGLLSPFVLMAPTENTGGPDAAMGVFLPEGGAPAALDDDIVWVEQEREGIVLENSQYSMVSSQFGWTNIDRWWSDPRPKTSIQVEVPEGWDDTNCGVYLSHDGEPTALARFDVYEPGTGLFSEHYGLIPVGLEVHVIFITELDGQWSYAIAGETIVENHLTIFDDPGALIETDLYGLVAAINALP